MTCAHQELTQWLRVGKSKQLCESTFFHVTKNITENKEQRSLGHNNSTSLEDTSVVPPAAEFVTIATTQNSQQQIGDTTERYTSDTRAKQKSCLENVCLESLWAGRLR